MATSVLILALLAASASPLQASEQRSASSASLNPIRKVVNLLQAMQKKVEEEGKAEKDLYDKFTCYCKTGGQDLAESVAAAEAKGPALTSDIEASEGKLEQAKADLKLAQTDRAAAKDAIAEAAALREKEAAAFAAEKADYDPNIAAIAKAVAALEKGVAGSFLQTPAALVVRRLAAGKANLFDGDRQLLVSFLSQGSNYAPQSGEITGILKTMGGEMAKSLAEATSAEEAAITLYDELVAAKKKEIEALTVTIELKTTQIGELGVSIVQMKADLTDTQATLLEDKKFLAQLEKSCATKASEWEERSKARAEELVALADTIKVLNDDDALELFKKTLPGPSASFVQVQERVSSVRARALAAVRGLRGAAAPADRVQLDLLALTLTGKRALSEGGFDKVIEMIDGMVANLKKEQQDDADKQQYCADQFDLGDDKKKTLERTVSDEEKAIATTEEGIATLSEEIAALEAGIKALDKSVAEATEQRKAENVEFKALMVSDGAAKELLGFAKNRLNKFYNPKLYKAPPKAELSAQGRTAESFGEAQATPAPGGIAGTGVRAVLVQVSEHSQQEKAEAPAPPPETWGAYQTKSEGGAGVVAMIGLLVTDLEKEMVEAETSEKDAQADYEATMKDAAEKRAADSKSLTERGAAKADLEGALEEHKQAKAAGTSELTATVQYIQSLHAECDWLLQYFHVRKEARTDEIDALGKAKAVLSGADYSLLQGQARRSLRRSL